VGFLETVKAAKKERALAKILNNNKLVRYAKSRIKSGGLDSHHLRRVLKRNTVVPRYRNIAAESTFVLRSPALPGKFAEFDGFFQAMQVIMEKERGE
jgi:hypothetical protein